MTATTIERNVAAGLPESLVGAALRLTQLREQGRVTEREFEAGLSNLFRKAQTEETPPHTDHHQVSFDWSKSPMKIKETGSATQYKTAFARVNRLLQPYFAYGWEYSGGSADEAVQFDVKTTRGSDGFVTIKGASVELVREMA